jgi:general secretion pathway protein H
MRTSAAGRADRVLPGRTHGFTLVELMVVITIVGLIAGLAVLALPDPEGGVRAEAVKFAARAKAAQERAVMDNRPVAIMLGEGGYAFEWRSGGKWQAVGERPFVAAQWREGTEARLEGAERRIVFDSTGFAERATLRLSRGSETAAVEVTNGGRIRVAP